MADINKEPDVALPDALPAVAPPAVAGPADVKSEATTDAALLDDTSTTLEVTDSTVDNVDQRQTTISPVVQNSQMRDLIIKLDYGGWREGARDKAEATRESIDSALLKKVQQVFVAPPHFDLVLDGERRILLVCGKESSGRLTCAIKLGLDLRAGSGPFEKFRPVRTPGQSLAGLVGKLDAKTNGIYIVEDVFQATGLTLEEFKSQSAVQAKLRDSNAWLILTTDANEAGAALALRLPTVHTDGLDSAAVLVQHVRAWYQTDDGGNLLPTPLADQICAIAGALGGRIQVPILLDLFCERIVNDSEVQREADPSKLREMLLARADTIKARNQREAEAWFNKLERNEQLFALLIGLFKGSDRGMLEIFYESIVNKLRAEKLPYLDPRQIGMEDIYRQLEIRIGKAEFADLAKEQQVQFQLHNYAPLMRSVTGIIQDLVNHYKRPEFWEFRQRLGHAIGRFGIGQFDTLRVELNQLAGHESGSVAKVAVYALQEISRNTGDHDRDILEVLKGWTAEGEPRRMWTAAVIIGAVHEEWSRTGKVPLLGDLSDQLTVLAEIYPRFHPRVRNRWLNEFRIKEAEALTPERAKTPLRWDDLTVEQKAEVQAKFESRLPKEMERSVSATMEAILRALQQMFANRPAETVDLVLKWLKRDPLPDVEVPVEPDEEEPLKPLDENASAPIDPQEWTARMDARRRMGEEAGLALFELTAQSAVNPEGLTAERHLPLLNLLPSLLDAPQAPIIDKVLRILASWLINPAWRERVAAGLLRTVHHAGVMHRYQLRRGLLRIWLNDRDLDIATLPLEVRGVVRRYAEVVLSRIRLMEGIPCDLPGGGVGVIVIDFGAKAKRANSPKFIYHIYEFLRAQTDVCIGWLGRTELLVPPDNLKESELWPREKHSHPRLLGPLLDQLDPATTHFVLMPYWGAWNRLHDLGDFLGSVAPTAPEAEQTLMAHPWRNRIIPVPVSFQIDERSDLPATPEQAFQTLPFELQMLFGLMPADDQRRIMEETRTLIHADRQHATRVNQLTIEAVFSQWIDPILADMLAQQLARRSAPDWWRLVKPYVEGHCPNPEPSAVANWLRRRVRLLDEFDQGADRVDSVRVLVCLLQWLATVDFALAIDVVAFWMASSESGEMLGLSATQMLLRVQVISRYLEHKQSPPLSSHASFLRLVPSLVQYDRPPWPALTLLLKVVHRCAQDPPWCMRFRRSPEGGLGEIAAGFRSAGMDLQAHLRKELLNWEAPTQAHEIPLSPHGRYLQSWLLGLLRPEAPIVDPDRPYGVVVLDESGRLDGVAKELLRQIQRLKLPTMQVVVYRLGESRPVALMGSSIPPPSEASPRPRLLGPILEHLNEEHRRFVVLISASLPLDIMDCVEYWPEDGFVCLENDQQQKARELPWQLIHRSQLSAQTGQEIFRLVQPLLPRS